MEEEAPIKSTIGPEQRFVDSVLLIDADNDPHLPPDLPLSHRTLVRLFLRTDAKAPRSLERKVEHLPFCVTVRSTKGGANASDFGMSLHAGILHATLPMHVPFTFVTADKALSVMVQELQRLGRVALIWTSHPDRNAAPTPSSSSSSRSRSSRSSGRSRRGGSGRSRSAPQAAPAPVASAPAAPSEAVEAAAPSVAGGKPIEQVAVSYAARLARVKGPPSRVKALLNDIKNRTVATGHTPEQVLEELKRLGALAVDDKGKVSYPPKG